MNPLTLIRAWRDKRREQRRRINVAALQHVMHGHVDTLEEGLEWAEISEQCRERNAKRAAKKAADGEKTK